MQPLSSFQSLVVRSSATLLSGGNALAILIFHRVMAERDPLISSEPDAETFATLMRLIAQNFTPLRLSDAIERLRNGTLPSRAVCVTFDDGYANNCEVALPILRSHGVPATVFVAPGFLNGGRMFNDTIIEAIRRAPAVFDLTEEHVGVLQLTDMQARQRAVGEVIIKLKHLDPTQRRAAVERIATKCGTALPNDLMMSDEQVRRLHRAGIEIGAHTMLHPILTRVDAATAKREMSESKSRLEEIIGSRVGSFAYPNGRPQADYNATHVALAKECGFDFALSTAWGTATAKSDLYQLPRLAPWDTTGLRYGIRIALGYRQRRYAQA